MFRHGIFAALVALTFMHDTYGATGDIISTKNSSAIKSKHNGKEFGNKELYQTTQYNNMSMRKTPGLDLPGYIIEEFLHKLDNNKTVFRYSELQQHLHNENILKRGLSQLEMPHNNTRSKRAVKDLPAIMDKLIAFGVNNSETNTTAAQDNSSVTANSSSTKRTTFEDLVFWSRDPIFDQPPTRPVRRSGKKKKPKPKKSLRQIREMERNLHKISGINRIGRYADLNKRAEDNGNGKMPLMALTYDRIRRKMVHIHGPKHRKKSRSRHSDEHDTRKSPQRNALIPMKLQSGNLTNLNGTNVTLLRAAEKDENNNEEKIELSPFSLAQQLREDLIPKLEEMGANVTLDILGRTIEYNDIIMLKAQYKADNKRFRADNQEKFDDGAPESRIILIVHGLSVMGFNKVPCLKRLNELTTLISFYYRHLEQFDIFLIPMANPDGVAMAQSRDFWNKNMSPQSACPGVDLDRNFDVAWNETLCSVSSCSQQFPGTEPFSEVETQAVRDVFHKYSHRIVGYINVHSSTYSHDVFKGDAILYPRGYTDQTSDDDRYIDMKGEIDETMKNASFKVYSLNVDTLYSWYGRVAGTSVDFASTVYGVPYAVEFAMQLYKDDEMVDDSQERETATVLNEVWGRVIDIVFNNIYKHLKAGEL